MASLRLSFGMLATLVVVGGCEEEMRPPPPPVGDGSTRDVSIMPPPPPSRDSGSMDATATDASTDAPIGDADGGDADGGLPLGCYLAGAGTGTDATLVTEEGALFPFAVTRSFATWDPAFCTVPPRTVIVGLTEGSCAPGADQLVFALSEEAIGTTLNLGPNSLQPEPDDLGLTVRFRTGAVGGAGETWGTCAGSSGVVDFSALGTSVGSFLTASYDMTLTDCTAPFDSPALTVSGTFDLPLSISFEAACE